MSKQHELVRVSDNPVVRTDSYKNTHWRQTPPGTQYVQSYFESRGGLFPEATFFGLQYYLKRYFIGRVVTERKLKEASDDFFLHFGNKDMVNHDGWQRIINVHGGRLPVRIWAVPEGTTVPGTNVLMAIQGTDPEIPSITNYLETVLVMTWYPTTVATQSRAMRSIILDYLEQTGDPDLIGFKLHDFGFRGSTSVESAGIGGMSHLVNFQGTDTTEGFRFARAYYGERMAGFSIPAAEHGTITPWGKEHEADAYANMLRAFPDGLVAVVSDSWDVFNACETIWGEQLRQMVNDRNGVLVIRPDSGDPPSVVCRVIEILCRKFGYRTNEKGYRVLNDKVRLIQGDGIDIHMLRKVLQALKESGYSADNIAFGSGGGLLQKVDRDTLKFAFKVCATKINGEWLDVMKDPVTDPGKRSKAGRLGLVRDELGEYRTMRIEDIRKSGLTNLLVPVFENGRLLVDHSFSEVRARALQK